jgi:hypothetical protein
MRREAFLFRGIPKRRGNITPRAPSRLRRSGPRPTPLPKLLISTPINLPRIGAIADTVHRAGTARLGQPRSVARLDPLIVRIERQGRRDRRRRASGCLGQPSAHGRLGHRTLGSSIEFGDEVPVCPCGGDERLRKIGEDVTETLELIPRQWKVIAHVRGKFSCRACEAITQAPAPRLPSPWPVALWQWAQFSVQTASPAIMTLGVTSRAAPSAAVKPEADSRCKQSKQSKNLQSFFRPSWVCHCETVRWGDGPHRTLRVTCLTIPGSSRQTTFRRARPRRWRRPCSRECSICRGHASSEPQWLRHRRRDPG